MNLPSIHPRVPFVMLRTVTGIIFITHGVARLYFWSFPTFGEFLNSLGLIIGLQLAWFITIGEVISGICLALGYKVRFCALFHATIILVGIFLIHLPQGWFTVGHGAGGVEYSLLLLMVLLFLYSKTHQNQEK
jgi:putative oxidoreductase